MGRQQLEEGRSAAAHLVPVPLAAVLTPPSCRYRSAQALMIVQGLGHPNNFPLTAELWLMGTMVQLLNMIFPFVSLASSLGLGLFR